MKNGYPLIIALLCAPLLLAIFFTGCTASSDLTQDDLKFIEKVNQSAQYIEDSNLRISSAYNSQDWAAMHQYCSDHLTQMDVYMLAVKPLKVTGKRVPAKDVWLKVLEGSQTAQRHSGAAAVAYEKGQKFSGDVEISAAIKVMEEMNADIKAFNDITA